MYVGRIAQLVDHFERCSLLTLDPVGIDRVHEGDRVLVGELAGEFQAVVEVGVDLHHFGTMHDCLRKFAGRNSASGQEHDGGQTRLRRVRSGRRRGVAGRGTDHGLHPLPDGDTERDCHATVLERTGRIGSLDLDPCLALHNLRQLLSRNQRRASLSEGDHRIAIGHWQPVAVASDHSISRTTPQRSWSVRDEGLGDHISPLRLASRW